MKVNPRVPDEGYSEGRLMKVILSVTWWRLFWASSDEGYSERRLMKFILSVAWWRLFWASPDEGYSERRLMKIILSVAWWRLFQKHVVCTKFDIYFFIIVINLSRDARYFFSYGIISKNVDL
jgi:hypothetical protein